MSQQLKDMALTRVSLVDKGANARRFAVLKRDEEDTVAATADDTPAGIAGWLRKAADLIMGTRVEMAAATPMPQTEAEMRKHLSAEHGLDAADMAMATMETKHNAMHKAGAEHSHLAPQFVKKTATFAEIVAGAELRDALSDSWFTLEDALWAAIYATDDNGQALPLEAKKALVAQDLDEFKSYLLAQMDTGVGKRDAGEPARAQAAVTALVAKVGRKLSASRVERLTSASEALNSVLAEVADAQEEAETAATAKEDIVEKAEIEAIVKAAVAEALAKSEKPPETPETPDEGIVVIGGALSLEGVAEAFIEFRDDIGTKVDALAKARGERTSADGQEGPEPVKKSRWAGVF
jgi:hypothetical protein